MFGSLVAWWYGRGWEIQLHAVQVRIERWVDYFSFAIILRTLFAPFRQIASGKVTGSIDVKFRFWLDRLVSRGVGFVVRLLTLLFGSVFMLLVLLISAVQLIGWVVLLLVPVLGIFLSVIGWVPWQS